MNSVVDYPEKPGAEPAARERWFARNRGPTGARTSPPTRQSRRDIFVQPAREEFGIDSLGRTELAICLERAFGARLPISLVAEADTVGDLLRVLEQARWSGVTIVAAPLAPPLPAVPAAGEAHTLLDVLEWHVAQHPDRLHVTVLEDEETVVDVTYGELAKSARAIAAGLIERDIVPGDRVALMLPTGMEFFAAFFGVLYAGAVPVPIYPPMHAPRSRNMPAGRRKSSAMPAPACS